MQAYGPPSGPDAAAGDLFANHVTNAESERIDLVDAKQPDVVSGDVWDDFRQRIDTI